eukprot:Em0015g678a
MMQPMIPNPAIKEQLQGASSTPQGPKPVPSVSDDDNVEHNYISDSGLKLLEIRGSDIFKYSLQLMDALFSEEELPSSCYQVAGRGTPSDKPPLSPRRVKCMEAKMQAAFVNETKAQLKMKQKPNLRMDAVQSFHWNNGSTTIHPFVCYHREKELCHLCYIIISESTQHDTVAVHLFQKKLITFLTKRTQGMDFEFVESKEHDLLEAKELEQRLARSRTVPGTQKLHCFIPTSAHTVEVKLFSYTPSFVYPEQEDMLDVDLSDVLTCVTAITATGSTK